MELAELDDLYRDAILDHCRHPRNQDRLEDADVIADGVNPFCGDEIHLQIRLDADGRAASVGLQGKGCAINQATGSILTEALKGKTLAEIEALSNTFRQMMRGEPRTEQAHASLGELEALVGVRQFPVRIKCALLAWATLEDGIEEYRKGRTQ